MNSKKKGMSLIAKQRAAGWTFLAPASILIAIMSFYPMVRAFIISLQKGTGANMRFTGFSNYQRILVDKVFQQSIGNTFFYLIIQVPIMLILAILLAQLLNNKHLKLRGLFRTCVFLPCATSLVSYSLIFRSMFATDGLINSILMKLGILHSGYNFLGHSGSVHHEDCLSSHRMSDSWRRCIYGGLGRRCHASGRILCPCHCPHMENKLRNNQDLF